MSNYVMGHSAEATAADYLSHKGFKIIELNWKTKYCEIDIVAEKDRAVYFVEVKYRRTLRQGHGLDYITTQKLKQMRFSAEMWVHNNNWEGEYQLAAVGVDGDTITFLDEL